MINYLHLERMALELRKKTFLAFASHGEAHLGGSFSIIEILIALYEEVLKPEDKFILSKSHASFPLCILLADKGMDPKLSTHLERDPENGIHATTGSLGHGLPIAAGMAMARKQMGMGGNIYVLISDGECQEGTTWESLLIASHHKLNNLILIVDYNKLQALDKIDEILPLHDLKRKFEAFNWECNEAIDGHNFSHLISAINSRKDDSAPIVILAHTIKGKGVPEFEGDPAWHAKKIKSEELTIGKKALGLI
jgi:transketolase